MATDLNCTEGCEFQVMAEMGDAFLGYYPPKHTLWSSAIRIQPEVDTGVPIVFPEGVEPEPGARTTVFENDNRWEAGFHWIADGCSEGACYPICVSCEPTPPEKTPNVDRDSVEVIPYQIYVMDHCSPGIDGFAERMVRKLTQAQVVALECAFSGGSCDQSFIRTPMCDPANPVTINHTLLNGPTAELRTELTDTLSPLRALYSLIDSLCACPTGIGMIHAPSYLVGIWHDSNMLKSIEVDYAADGWFPNDSGGRKRVLIEKNSGHIVVPGCGYSGFGPGVTVPDANSCITWAYATSMPFLMVGDIQVYNTVLREANLDTMIAERTLGITFDPCCHTAIQVDLCKADRITTCS